MALECGKAKDTISKKSAGRAWIKQAKLTHSKNCISDHIPDPNLSAQAENKSFLLKSATGFQPKKTTAESSGADDSAANGRRSITDLPQALVSEILCRLDAKELGIVSCVSTLLHSIASDHKGWREFYCQRWGPPLGSTPFDSGLPEKAWKDLFIEREFRSKSFMGRYSMDMLRGHTEAVRSVFLLPEAKLIFTGGYDSVVRVWDMEDGLSISSSRPLGCTIRAVTADTQLLVAGGTDSFLQCWRAIEGHPHLFDVTGFTANSTCEFRLWGHEGPVTCVALDPSRIFSGSWDMSVRIWDRAKMKCLKVLRHGDWVWSLVPRGSTVASTAGRDIYVWDIENGDQMAVIGNAHAGNAYSLAWTLSGDLLFTGGEDGAIHLFKFTKDGSSDDIKPFATWIPHTAAVHSLAFEFPWIVSCSSDGRLALIDVRKLLKSRHRPSTQDRLNMGHVDPNAVEPPQRMLHGFGCNLFSVSIGADRIVCGGEEGVVRVWNFSQALEIEKRVRALRGIRLENRMRRRKVQIDLSSKSGSSDQCSVAAKRNQMKGDKSGIWHSKRGVSWKLKA